MAELSVIVSFLDAAPFLAEAIESVLQQTFTDWELILVDDGSRDESSAVALAFAQRYPERVHYLEHPDHANRGISASRNLGIDHAGGKLIAFLDADDCYLPNRLERHVKIAEAFPEVDMVQSNTLRWFSWEQNNFFDRPGRVPMPEEQIVEAPNLLHTMLLHGFDPTLFPCTCSVTVRKSAIEELGGFEEGFPRFCEDWVFWQKIYAHKSVYVTPDIVARYRKHGNSILHRAANDFGSLLGPRYQAHVQYLRWLRSYLLQHGSNAALLSLVDSQLWPDNSPFLRDVVGLPPALRLTVDTIRQRAQGYLRRMLGRALAPIRTLRPDAKATRTDHGR